MRGRERQRERERERDALEHQSRVHVLDMYATVSSEVSSHWCRGSKARHEHRGD